MVRLHVRKVAGKLASRHVRQLTPRSADRLMDIVIDRGLAHKGNRKWLAERKGEYGRCYLIPALDMHLKSSDIRCILALLDRRNRAVWMTLDVSPWMVLGLPKLRGRKVVHVMGRLASNSPVVPWDGSLGS